MKTDTQTGRGKLISTREIMGVIGIGRSMLRNLMNEGMPYVCLNPDSIGTRSRRYRFNPEAVLAWLNERSNRGQKGVEA